MAYYRIIRNYISPELCETFVNISKGMIGKNYTQENLESHLAYLSDKQPGRESYAFALTNQADCKLPSLWTMYEEHNLYNLHNEMLNLLCLTHTARTLVNFQIYNSDSAPVPPHFDGELLDFAVLPDGSLDIYEAIRPEEVVVLTLINQVKGGVGTTLHTPDGVETVYCNAGDLLLFNNVDCKHSVQSFSGESTREDKILRMTIGWRSLGEKCRYFSCDQNTDRLPLEQCEKIIQHWLTSTWPDKWKEIQTMTHKAAF